MNVRSKAAPAALILESVLRLERTLDLSDPLWQQDDVHWWPLYRLELYRLLFITLASAATAPARRPRLGPAWRHALTPEARLHAAPVWLVSDGISFSRIGDCEVERFCEPLRLTCESIGLPAVLIDRGSDTPRRSIPPTRWWAPYTQRAKITAALATRLRPDPRHAALVRSVQRVASAAGVHLPALDARRFDAMARAVLSLACDLGAVMRRERPRAVFVVGYYDVSGYAYMLAAAREGIASVDLQHGVAGRYNLAYADWPQRAAGWRLLPRWFWTWTDSDAHLIRRWAGTDAVGTNHRAVCGGHPFLQAWRHGLLTPGATTAAALQRLLDAAGPRTRVLVTLQPHLLNATDLSPLIEAWRRRPDVAWWLRLHPMALQDREPLRALLDANGVRGADIDTATDLPLPLLLSHAHVHATHSSSTFIEAAAMGLRSIIWSRYGAELAEDAVADGSTLVALDGAALVQAMDRLPAGGLAQPSPQRTSMQQALRAILELPQ